MIKVLTTLVLHVLLLPSLSLLQAQEYRIDTEGAHASINFKIKHLGYSWLTGRFNHLKGQFYYDVKNPDNTRITVSVDTASIDSNHAERDIHLRGKKFLNVKKFPQATFTSTHYQPIDEKRGKLTGDFSLHGVTRPITMVVTQLGAGRDPWGGFRRGFETRFKIRLHDYGIKHNLGAASEELELTIYIEGIKDDKYLGL